MTRFVAARESAAPVPVGSGAGFHADADVVVVGGGGGGLPAALFARWLGDEVILLEKAPELGGTARKAAFWYWVPNESASPAAEESAVLSTRTMTDEQRTSVALEYHLQRARPGPGAARSPWLADQAAPATVS